MVRNAHIDLIHDCLPLPELVLYMNPFQQKVIIHYLYCDLLIIASINRKK